MGFHVPEPARILDGQMGTAPHAGQYGAFRLPSPEPGWELMLICDDGTHAEVPESLGWEHVSVHARRPDLRQRRTPSWKEMAFVKGTCWDDEDVVVQYHPRRSEYVNLHEHVLHLWRHNAVAFPTPPAILVGPVVEDTARQAATDADEAARVGTSTGVGTKVGTNGETR